MTDPFLAVALFAVSAALIYVSHQWGVTKEDLALEKQCRRENGEARDAVSRMVRRRDDTILNLKHDVSDLRKLIDLQREELVKHGDIRDRNGAEINRLAELIRTKNKIIKDLTAKIVPEEISEKEIEKLNDDVRTLVRMTSRWTFRIQKQKELIYELTQQRTNDAALRASQRAEIKRLKDQLGTANAL